MSETFNDDKVVMTEVIETKEVEADDNPEREEVDVRFKESMASDVKFRRSFMYKAYKHLWHGPITFIFMYTRKVSTYCSNKIERLLLPW
tara:strand:+ start:95 stop:361 length:267 start_codon:yes stop_codon:yes gene_type:complete